MAYRSPARNTDACAVLEESSPPLLGRILQQIADTFDSICGNLGFWLLKAITHSLRQLTGLHFHLGLAGCVWQGHRCAQGVMITGQVWKGAAAPYGTRLCKPACNVAYQVLRSSAWLRSSPGLLFVKLFKRTASAKSARIPVLFHMQGRPSSSVPQ